MSRPDLQLGRLLAVWAPLAATYLLVTGGTPIVNASINRLPGRDHAADLAAFAVLLSCIIVIHSPLFVTREIAIKMSVDRDGSRRALRFCLAAGAVVALFEALLGATPLGALLLGAFTERQDLVERAHRAFLVVWPVPLLIAVRGVYQAHQIRVDDTLFVGLGTLVRLGLTAVFGLVLAPRLGIPGPLLGALCITFGLIAESIFAVSRARARARPPEQSDAAPISAVRFGLPLMFANLLGVATQLFYLRIAGAVPAEAQEASLAGFQEVKSLHLLLGAGALALQPLTTAKVQGDADVAPIVRFTLVVGAGMSLLFGILAVVPPARDWVLIELMNERPGGDVLRFATPALAVAASLPCLGALRFCLRGVLIARGHTRAITFSNVLVLILLGSAISFKLLPFERNGALNAYFIWLGALIVEIVILARAVRRPGEERPPLPPPLRSPREASAG